MNVLQGMLPRDLLHYCQEHGLLDSILVPPAQEQQGFGPPSGGRLAPPEAP
jgi:hypothetical protein